MSSVEFVQGALRYHVAPPGAGVNVSDRIRVASRRCCWPLVIYALTTPLRKESEAMDGKITLHELITTMRVSGAMLALIAAPLAYIILPDWGTGCLLLGAGMFAIGAVCEFVLGGPWEPKSRQ